MAVTRGHSFFHLLHIYITRQRCFAPHADIVLMALSRLARRWAVRAVMAAARGPRRRVAAIRMLCADSYARMGRIGYAYYFKIVVRILSTIFFKKKLLK